ncbi:apolipoprotein E-like [Aphelocoma coerulescens]|uniref:apolipoprotein E-like n=1 Tax=Aphelocoma coerulescens TaxID=39617 RepID=UPI00360530EF
MKFWVALVAVTLLAGCGADDPSPTPKPPAPPALPSKVWGLLGALEEVAKNATERLRESPLGQRLQNALRELRELRDEARGRVAEYGAEARALLELSAADLRARGAAFARKLRKRLNRDSEELRRRWDGGAAAIRALWAPPEPPRDGED